MTSSIPFYHRTPLSLRKSRVRQLPRSELKISHNHRFTCVGTSEEDTFKDPHTLAELPETVDDFDVSCKFHIDVLRSSLVRLGGEKLHGTVIDVVSPLPFFNFLC